MLHLARGHSLADLGLFTFESLSTELVLAALGVGIAAFWDLNPWLIPFARRAAPADPPLAAACPRSRRRRASTRRPASSTRATSRARCNEELARAARFERPLSLIMADLDLLRDINNTYGHLAGDAVLKGIAEVFRAAAPPLRRPGAVRRRGVRDPAAGDAARAGVRDRRADPPRGRRRARSTSRPSSEPIRATVSIGVAAFPRDGDDANELIHQADLAVYRAKLQGRNRVLDASAEPLLVPEKRRAAPRRGAASSGEHVAHAPAAPTRWSRTPDAAPSAARTRCRARASCRSRGASRSSSRSSAIAGIAAGVAGHRLLRSARHHRPARGRRARRRRPGARARGRRRRLDLGLRGRRARRRRAVRHPRRARARAHHRRRRVERAALAAPPRAVQHRRALARRARGGARLRPARPRQLDGSDLHVLAAGIGLAAGAAYFAVNMGLLSLALGVEGQSAGGASGTSASPGCCRTTSSTASSAA